MKKIILIFGFNLTLIFNLMSQVSTSAVPFLLISPNARASGMGEVGTGLADDVSSIYWNPAGLAQLQGHEASITHSNWLPQFQLSDLYYDYFNYRQYFPELEGNVAASITFFNLGKFARTNEQGPEVIEEFTSFEYAITLGYGTFLTQDFMLGLNLRFINSRLAPFGTGSEEGSGIGYAVSADIGGLYKPKELIIPFVDLDLGNNFSAGFNLSNLGPKITYIDDAQADPIPTNLRIGFAFYPLKDEYNSIQFAADFSKLLIRRGKDLDGDGEIKTDEEKSYTDPYYKAIFTSWIDQSMREELRAVISSFGVEYWYGKPKLVALRAGYFYEDPNYGNRKFKTFGAGIRYDIYGFDFSWIQTEEEFHPLSETLRFTLLIGW
ncbi:MAG: type IX secretion system outer membrane channel protein PorV [Bacteroidetes bacterium]|nr:type IX secretion system outer membrane channel protein PorV [Bacteroidota bacterium]